MPAVWHGKLWIAASQIEEINNKIICKSWPVFFSFHSIPYCVNSLLHLQRICGWPCISVVHLVWFVARQVASWNGHFSIANSCKCCSLSKLILVHQKFRSAPHRPLARILTSFPFCDARHISFTIFRIYREASRCVFFFTSLYKIFTAFCCTNSRTPRPSRRWQLVENPSAISLSRFGYYLCNFIYKMAGPGSLRGCRIVDHVSLI